MRALTRIILLPLLILAACDGDASSPPGSGTIVLGHDQGVDFSSGMLQKPGSYANSDLYATTNGDSGMKLATGGATIIDNRPISWFKTGGGIATSFPDLESVPLSPLPTLPADPMLHAKLGFGFLSQTGAGDYVRGWISAASPSSVTIDWQRLVK